MNSTEEQLRTQLAEAEAKLETEKRLHRSALIFVDQGYAREAELRAKLAAAAKIIKPFADMRPLCGENEREAIMARMLGGVDYAWEDRRVCLEVRHLTDAYNWIKENGNE